MEKVAANPQENSGDILTENEKECLRAILGSEEYKSNIYSLNNYGELSNNEIKNKLNMHLMEKEKDSIYEISAMDDKLKELKGKLEDLDQEFKKLEDDVDKQTNEYLGIIKDLSNCESQNKIIDIRLRNQQALKETLQMLVGDTDFSKEELAILTTPNFDDSNTIEKIYKTLVRLAKYIKNSGKFKSNQFIVSKNNEYSEYVENFQNKMKDQLTKIGLKAFNDYKEKSKNSISFPDTSYFRISMTNYKKIFDIIFQIHDNSDIYISSFLKNFGDIISSFISPALELFEKKWKTTILTFNLFKSKFSLSTSVEINPSTMNSNQAGDKKLSNFIQETVSDIYNSIVSDEDYWPKYFGTNQKKISKDNEDFKAMLETVYSKVKTALLGVIDECKNASALSLFFFLSVVSNLIEARKKEADNSDFEGLYENTYSFGFLLELSTYLTTQLNYFSSDQIKSLDKYDADKKTVEILIPVKNLALMVIFLKGTFPKTSDIYLRYIKELYDIIKPWIFKKAASNPRGKEVIIIENCYYLGSSLIKIQDEYFSAISKEMMDIYEKTSLSYVKLLFSQTFPEFWGYWTKIKEISDQTDVSGLQLSGAYSKMSFTRLIKSTFSGFGKGLEKMIGSISKQVTTEEGLAKNLYKKLMKFIGEEYEEIETFAKRAYDETLTPSHLEIQALMVERQIESK